MNSLVCDQNVSPYYGLTLNPAMSSGPKILDPTMNYYWTMGAKTIWFLRDSLFHGCFIPIGSLSLDQCFFFIIQI
jgi:hypothetical protein